MTKWVCTATTLAVYNRLSIPYLISGSKKRLAESFTLVFYVRVLSSSKPSSMNKLQSCFKKSLVFFLVVVQNPNASKRSKSSGKLSRHCTRKVNLSYRCVFKLGEFKFGVYLSWVNCKKSETEKWSFLIR